MLGNISADDHENDQTLRHYVETAKRRIYSIPYSYVVGRISFIYE